MSLIRVDRHLPPQLSIKLIDNILYLTGLSGKWVGERPKRFLLNTPLFITLFLLAHILLRCVSYRSDDRLILLFTADFRHLMGAKKFCNTVMILLSLMALSSLAIHYHNKFIGMKTTFNGLFEMLSGSRTPASLGLNDPAQVEQLLKIAKWLPLLKKNNAIFAPLVVWPTALDFQVLYWFWSKLLGVLDKFVLNTWFSNFCTLLFWKLSHRKALSVLDKKLACTWFLKN